MASVSKASTTVQYVKRNFNNVFFITLAKDCGPLLTPKNGSMSGGQTTFPNEINFSCYEGFIMKGPEKRRCQADGTWSENVTSCEGM